MNGLHTFLLFHALACLAHGSEIINGEKAKEHTLLYMASVQNYRGHICGGFFIREDFIVTAAHCDQGLPKSVVFGNHNLKRADNKEIQIQKKYKHPSFDSVAHGEDIMLLKLAHRAQLDNKVHTIQLPTSKLILKENMKCHVAGWGATKTKGGSVDELREVTVSIIDLQICKEKWEQINLNLPDNVICAGGYDTNKGFCQGDSGGPLVCNGMAVGIVSFNRNRNCMYPDLPNVYTDISEYLPWINTILKGTKHYE